MKSKRFLCTLCHILASFFVHTKVRIDRDDKEGLQGLDQHIIRCPIVVYYGYYSQAARGKRRKNGTHYNRSIPGQVEDDNRILRYRGSQLIKMVYADPLICPSCGGRMKIIAFIKV